VDISAAGVRAIPPSLGNRYAYQGTSMAAPRRRGIAKIWSTWGMLQRSSYRNVSLARLMTGAVGRDTTTERDSCDSEFHDRLMTGCCGTTPVPASPVPTPVSCPPPVPTPAKPPSLMQWPFFRVCN
jgi:hypothetical protein